MARVGGDKGIPHLFSLVIASGLAAVVLFAGQTAAVHLERSTVPSTAPELFRLKNQGLAFQRAAVRAPNVLPLYGTSELITPSIPERASLFFRSAPTGFQVSPVGGAGANLLVMLQKVGALGSDLRGKKLVISLSPGWFLKVKSGQKGYEANFSPMGASKMIFDTALNFELKRDIASRMLKCPSTLEGRPLLRFAVRRLASGGWLDRIVFCALWPAGKLQNHYTKLRALVQRYHFPLVEFKGGDEDPAFLVRHESHLSAKGWMYYNRALDDFFHGRMPRS
jgi:poly-D-alanine transfer protein DltD